MAGYKFKAIKYTMLIINVLAVLFVAVFIYITTDKICNYFIAREFVEHVLAVPQNPEAIIIISVALLCLLILSFLVREQFEDRNPFIEYGSLVIDFIICISIIIVLNFNYNGIILWVFANVLSHMRDYRGRYILIVLAIISFLGTDYELISINIRLFSVNDYFRYYEANTQQYLLSAYNLLLSINMIVFIIYCIVVIQSQRGTIEEVNQLYHKLTTVNGELQKANVSLQKYAIMKEKMGETKERNRLAREIHDTLGHTLTGLSAGIDACIATIDNSKENTKLQLERLASVSREGIKEVRRSVNELRPDALERLNLEYAITKMITELNAMTKTRIFFSCKVKLLKFDADEENAIYRVIQESITNSIRHGSASQIWITIEQESTGIHLKIRDNGIGCQEFNSGFGTQHIMERIKLLNGQVTFDGKEGFTVEAIIPIRWGEEYD